MINSLHHNLYVLVIAENELQTICCDIEINYRSLHMLDRLLDNFSRLHEKSKSSGIDLFA